MESDKGQEVASNASTAIVVRASVAKSSGGTFGRVRYPNEVDKNSDGYDVEPICSLPTNNPKDNPASVLTEDDLKSFESLYGLSAGSISLPQPHERADNESFDGLCLYEKLFQLGLRLPISPFIQDVLMMYGCAPGRLMPNGWRVLLGLQVLGEQKDIPISPATVRFAYHTRESNGRTQLSARDARSERHLILHNPAKEEGNTKWKGRFFIASRDLVLGKTEPRSVPTKWKASNKIDKGTTTPEEVEIGAAMILKLPSEERSVEKLLSPDMLVGTSLWSTLVSSFGGSGDACVEELRRAQRACAVMNIPKGSKVSRVVDKLLGNRSKKARIGSTDSMTTVTPTCAELELRREDNLDDNLDMVPQQPRDLSVSLADHVNESDLGGCSERLIVGEDTALALSSDREGMELTLTKDGARRAKEGPLRNLDDVFSRHLDDVMLFKRLIASGEEENRLLQSKVHLLHNEKRKLEMEAAEFKRKLEFETAEFKRKLEFETAEFKRKLDETVAAKDGLLEAHVKYRSELMREIEERKKDYMNLELTLEKQKEDSLIQVEMTKDVAAMQSRLDFMVKIVDKEWEISQAAAEILKIKEWLGNVSKADYEIGVDGCARNKNYMDDDDMSSTSSE